MMVGGWRVWCALNICSALKQVYDLLILLAFGDIVKMNWNFLNSSFEDKLLLFDTPNYCKIMHKILIHDKLWKNWKLKMTKLKITTLIYDEKEILYSEILHYQRCYCTPEYFSVICMVTGDRFIRLQTIVITATKEIGQNISLYMRCMRSKFSSLFDSFRRHLGLVNS